MSKISPEELLGQLREMVELLASPAERQLAWAREDRWPNVELFLQFEDAVPIWFERLRRQALIDPLAETALIDLLHAFDGMGSETNDWSDEALRLYESWERVRSSATKALLLLNRPDASSGA